jgi:predicted dehydrogenase
MNGSQSWGILGGRFGLYGYLPALSRLPKVNVLIEQKHLPFLQSRAELKPFASVVQAVASASEVLALSDSIVLAVPPMAQEQLIAEAHRRRKYRHLILEKPVAATPAGAHATLALAGAMCEALRVGYTFLYTDWCQELQNQQARAKTLRCKLRWTFCAHHFKPLASPSWKSEHAQGGGALRFYGIQLIALFASLGCDTVHNSRIYCNGLGQVLAWRATLSSAFGVTADLELDSNSPQECFEITNEDSEWKLSMANPFATSKAQDGDDARVPVLERLLQSFQAGPAGPENLDQDINRLWEAAEQSAVWLTESGEPLSGKSGQTESGLGF